MNTFGRMQEDLREGVFSQNLKVVELSRRETKQKGAKWRRFQTQQSTSEGVWQHERIVRENNNLLTVSGRIRRWNKNLETFIEAVFIHWYSLECGAISHFITRDWHAMGSINN